MCVSVGNRKNLRRETAPGALGGPLPAQAPLVLQHLVEAAGAVAPATGAGATGVGEGEGGGSLFIPGVAFVEVADGHENQSRDLTLVLVRLLEGVTNSSRTSTPNTNWRAISRFPAAINEDGASSLSFAKPSLL